jgi:hypothetical protein
MNARNLLLAVTFVLAVTETVDIVDTGIAAAVFAALVFACGAWVWRRGSMIAATILGLQFLVEVTQAHTWKDTSMALKVFVMVVGTIGLAALAAVVVDRVRRRRIAGGATAQTES